MNASRSLPRLAGAFELAEPMLEQLVGALQVCAQPPDRSRAVLACERLSARPAEDLAMHADEQARGDASVAFVDTELALDRVGDHLREVRHHLQLLRLQRGRLFDDPRERRETRTAKTRTLAQLQPAQCGED